MYDSIYIKYRKISKPNCIAQGYVPWTRNCKEETKHMNMGGGGQKREANQETDFELQRIH